MPLSGFSHFYFVLFSPLRSLHQPFCLNFKQLSTDWEDFGNGAGKEQDGWRYLRRDSWRSPCWIQELRIGTWNTAAQTSSNICSAVKNLKLRQKQQKKQKRKRKMIKILPSYMMKSVLKYCVYSCSFIYFFFSFCCCRIPFDSNFPSEQKEKRREN